MRKTDCAHAAALRRGHIRLVRACRCNAMGHSRECEELARTHAAETRLDGTFVQVCGVGVRACRCNAMAHLRKCAELVRTQAAATRWRIRVSTRSWPARQPLQRMDCTARAEPANQPAIPSPAPQSVNGIAQSLSAVYAPVRRNFICKSLSCCNNPY